MLEKIKVGKAYVNEVGQVDTVMSIENNVVTYAYGDDLYGVGNEATFKRIHCELPENEYDFDYDKASKPWRDFLAKHSDDAEVIIRKHETIFIPKKD